MNIEKEERISECEGLCLTGEQGVSVVLLENTTHTRDVLDSELEHHQVHRSSTYLIVFFQVSMTDSTAVAGPARSLA